MSERHESEIAKHQFSESAADLLDSKYGEVGMAAVAAALRLMAKPASSDPAGCVVHFPKQARRNNPEARSTVDDNIN